MNFFRIARCLVFIIVVLIWDVSFPQGAWAQRGSNYEPKSLPPQTPLTGFPGLFDTNVADEGSLVVGMPSFAVDYGLTDHLSVGANGWSLLPLVSGVPSIIVKTRYRFLSESSVQSTVSLHGGYIGFRPSSGPRIDAFLSILTNNTSFFIGDQTLLNLSLLRFSVSGTSGQRTDLDYSAIGFTGYFAAIGGQHFFGKSFGAGVLLMQPLYVDIAVDSAVASGNVNSFVSAGSSSYPGIRLMGEFRLGKRWLLSPGAFISYSDPQPAAKKADDGSGDTTSNEESGTSGGLGITPLVEAMFRF
jgi:hypothetical protein